MLSRMLRAVLLLQVFVGALLGWLIARYSGLSNWAALAGALLLPLVTMKLTIVTSAVLSREPGASALWWRSLVGEILATARVFFLQLPLDLVGAGVQTRHWRPAAHWGGAGAWLPVQSPHLGRPDRAPAPGRAPGAGSRSEADTSIDDYVPLISQAVENLCRETGAAKVALVGHSMGGLAIRAWMRVHGTDQVARVLTLGTPHAGTRIVHPYSTPNGQQMVWQSAWLKELRSE